MSVRVVFPVSARALAALVVSVAALVCAGCSDNPSPQGQGGGGGGSIDNPMDQPAIVALEVEGTLGRTLVAPESVASGELPGRVVSAMANVDEVCVLDEAGAVFCWGDLAPGGESPGARYPTAPSRVRGPGPVRRIAMVATSPNSQYPCAYDTDGSAWCWNRHPSTPHNNDVLTAARVADPMRGYVPPGPQLPADFLSHIEVGAGIARIGADGGQVCGVGATGALWCAHDDGEGVSEQVATLPAGSKLSGECFLTPAGAAHCHLPFAQGPGYPLGLKSFTAQRGRGCGETSEGAWRCFGRPAGFAPIVFDGFEDVTVDQAVRAAP